MSGSVPRNVVAFEFAATGKQNVPKTLEDQALRQFFSTCGTVQSISSVENGLTQTKNVHIEFDTPTTASIAVELSGTVLHGAPIMVRVPFPFHLGSVLCDSIHAWRAY